jgi:hypothetical protein
MRKMRQMAHKSWLLILGALVLQLVAVEAAFSQNATTPSPVVLSSTFASISVKAPFSGDADGNNSATIQFRVTGAGSWTNAYTPFVDRRAALGGSTNQYANQARGSIVGLTANTSYDVQVTWTDPDGVSGGQPALATISTLSPTPPTGGSTITVTNNATLATALSTVAPGQTIHLNAGTYAPFTINRSGSAAAWIVVEGAAGGATVVSGVGAAQNIAVNANYLLIRNLTLSASDSSGIVLAGNSTHVFVQDSTLLSISTLCAANPSGHYGDVGILVGSGSNNIYILRNTVIASAALALASCTLNPIWNSPGTGISWTTVTTLVVDSNTVTGGFRDAISLDDDDLSENVDLVNNTVEGYKDDGIESKGGDVNVRAWNNHITADQADTCMAGNTNLTTDPYGPLYLFRNNCSVTTSNTQGETVFKLPGGTPTFVFHNSIDTSTAPASFDGFNLTAGTPIFVYNNIMKTNGSAVDYGNGTFDYNFYDDVNGGSSLVYEWNGGSSYDTLATFRSGTGQETHGLSGDPLYTDTALHVPATGPTVDKGVVLSNFNSLDSAWPYSGSAPDMGAYESSTGTGPPAAPVGLVIQ